MLRGEPLRAATQTHEEGLLLDVTGNLGTQRSLANIGLRTFSERGY